MDYRINMSIDAHDFYSSSIKEIEIDMAVLFMRRYSMTGDSADLLSAARPFPPVPQKPRLRSASILVGMTTVAKAIADNAWENFRSLRKDLDLPKKVKWMRG